MSKLIRFDWAIKNILRDKANFGILEGLLSELLKTDISILELLESESNRQDALDKSNRVDLLVKSDTGELILIEIQNSTEWDYFQRMLFGTSKLITEHLQIGMAYKEVKKVIALHVVYFDLGQGQDYLYHGITRFIGLHSQDELQLSQSQQKLFEPLKTPSEIFPEYYLLKVEKFSDMIQDRFDEWVYFLKHEEIKEEFQAKGIHEAKAKLDVLQLSEADRQRYESYIEDLRYEASMVWSSHEDGRLKGLEQGRQEGLQAGELKGERKKQLAIAKQMKAQGFEVAVIADLTGLSKEDIEKL